MAGLQGVGKTTACGKLANLLKKQNRKVLLVATDVYRYGSDQTTRSVDCLLALTLGIPDTERGR